MRAYRAVIVVLMLLALPLAAGEEGLRIHAGVGVVEGEAREVLYAFLPVRYKVSELTWDLKQVWTVGLGAEIALAEDVCLEVGARSRQGRGTAICRTLIG